MSTSGTEVKAAGWYDDPVGQARSRYWDGQSWTAQTSNAKDPTAGSAALGNGFARLSDWVGRMLLLVVLSLVLVVGLIWWGYTLLSPYASNLPVLFQPDSVALTPQLESDLNTVLIALLLAFAASSLLSLTTGILWWVWQYQLAAAAPGQLRRTPGMHLASWIIPIVNWWWPYQNMKDLWAAYRIGHEGAEATASPIGLWWSVYIGGPFVSGLVFSMVVLPTSPPDQVLARLAACYAVMFLVYAGAALLARDVVRKLSWRALVFWAAMQQESVTAADNS